MKQNENTTPEQGHSANVLLCKAGYNHALNLIEENIGVYKFYLAGARAINDEMEKRYRMGQIHALQELRFELINSQPSVASEGEGEANMSACTHSGAKNPLPNRMEQCMICKEILMISG